MLRRARQPLRVSLQRPRPTCPSPNHPRWLRPQYRNGDRLVRAAAHQMQRHSRAYSSNSRRRQLQWHSSSSAGMKRWHRHLRRRPRRRQRRLPSRHQPCRPRTSFPRRSSTLSHRMRRQRRRVGGSVVIASNCYHAQHDTPHALSSIWPRRRGSTQSAFVASA